MENVDRAPSQRQDLQELPTLLRHVNTEDIAGFDSVDCNHGLNDQARPSQTSDACPSQFPDQGSQVASGIKPTELPDLGGQSNLTVGSTQDLQLHANVSHQTCSVSVSMPASPMVSGTAKRVVFNDEAPVNGGVDPPLDVIVDSSQKPEQKFYSQPIQLRQVQSNSCLSQNGKCYDSFKTWSGRLERQISNLRGRPQELPPYNSDNLQANDAENIPVDRYFDALEGPELDTLKASEVAVLPEDKQWPFLLRFPISSYGICLGLSSQAILWKWLATTPSVSFLHINLKPNLVLWSISLALVVLVSSIYLFKIIFYFEAVKREYYHPVRVNFFFAPWIACLFLALGIPPSIVVDLRAPVWYILMAPILCLELKIYGQWMSGGQRRLSKVANPSNHLSIVGNFVGALLGANMGLKEGPIFFFAIGLAHYIVLFVTLYQRLPTNVTLPKELHPVFFLFVAAPSVACVAWAKIREDFDYGSRIAYFTAIFLYVSLAVRINFFRGFRFSLAWWAYTFPMTGAAIATIRYSMEKTHPFTQSVAVALTVISTLMVFALLVMTIIHAFVLRDLFPNDISIAISEKRSKPIRKRHHGLYFRTSSSDSKDKDSSDSSENLRSQLSV